MLYSIRYIPYLQEPPYYSDKEFWFATILSRFLYRIAAYPRFPRSSLPLSKSDMHR